MLHLIFISSWMRVSIYLFIASLYIHGMNNAVYVNQTARTKKTVSKHASGESIICTVSLASDHSAAPQTRSQMRSVPSPFYISLDEPQALTGSILPPPDTCSVPDFNELLCISEPFSPPTCLYLLSRKPGQSSCGQKKNTTPKKCIYKNLIQYIYQ